MATSKESKQVFDISKPGQTAAAATARPVIVNHGPMLKDPMMSNQTEADNPDKKQESEAVQTTPSENRKVIDPPSDAGETEGSTTNNSASTKTDDKNASVQNASEGKADKSTDTPQASKPDSSTAILDAVVGQDTAKKKNEPTKEEVARIAELEKLVESKQYYVKVKSSAKKRHARWLVVVVLIAVIIAGVYLAIDAKLINIGLTLPLDLIH